MHEWDCLLLENAWYTRTYVERRTLEERKENAFIRHSRSSSHRQRKRFLPRRMVSFYRIGSAWRKERLLDEKLEIKLTIRRSPFTYDMSADVQSKRKFMRNVDRRDVRALKNNNAFVISADTTSHILAITSGRLWSWATKALHLAVVSNFPYKAFKSIYFSSVYLGSRAHL